MSNLDMKFRDVVGTCFMSTHNFSYNFLTRIKYVFRTVATVGCEVVVALDIPSAAADGRRRRAVHGSHWCTRSEVGWER